MFVVLNMSEFPIVSWTKHSY